MHDLYDWMINHVQLNLLDSHDMARALWIMGEDKSALRLAVLFQMTMPGAPCIYYGDEIGLSSAGDPYCRAAFPWQAEGSWAHDLLTFYQQAIALRQRYPVLRTGTFQTLYAEGQVYAFQRQLGPQQALVIFNAATEAETIILNLAGIEISTLIQVWPDSAQNHQVTDDQLTVTVPAREALVLVGE
jgi:neopullulanase